VGDQGIFGIEIQYHLSLGNSLDNLSLLIDFHLESKRQGPGGDEQTQLALRLSDIAPQKPVRVADIGCGTGASTVLLAEALNASIAAVDFLPEFLSVLNETVRNKGLSEKIESVNASMDALEFDDNSFDLIWSEGAIYNIGFVIGIKSWRKFLKIGGILAVSELTWLQADIPAELREHWDDEYPEVDFASTKLRQLEDNGYRPKAYFVLPKECWLDNYYTPIEKRFANFMAKHNNSDAARSIVEAEKREIELYKRYSDYVSYGFYIAERVD